MAAAVASTGTIVTVVVARELEIGRPILHTMRRNMRGVKRQATMRHAAIQPRRPANYGPQYRMLRRSPGKMQHLPDRRVCQDATLNLMGWNICLMSRAKFCKLQIEPNPGVAAIVTEQRRARHKNAFAFG